jgi:pimeloyl-ACP methyl ester carboxylesterase
MRGYGQSDRPAAIEQYTMLHLVGDMIGLMDALGAETAVIAGHDWGAPVAWSTALMRPDRVRGVLGLSVPYLPRGALSPLAVLRAALGEDFYMVYFQQPGVAEAELERNPRDTLRRLLYSASGDAPSSEGQVVGNAAGGLLSHTLDPERLPDWLSETDVDFYGAEFARSGFAGGLNWYRNLDRNWELTGPWHGAQVKPPAYFMAGDRDLVLAFPGFGEIIAGLQAYVPNLRGSRVLPGCGHWTQQERPAEVNDAMLEFLRGL